MNLNYLTLSSTKKFCMIQEVFYRTLITNFMKFFTFPSKLEDLKLSSCNFKKRKREKKTRLKFTFEKRRAYF